MQNNIPDTPECFARHMGLYLCENSAIQTNLYLIKNGLMPKKSMEDFEEEIDNISNGDYEVIDGIAIIQINGVMQKPVSKLFGFCSTIKTRASINQACNDDAVKGIMLVFETPGGFSAGTAELSDCIANCEKPIRGYISDNCHSAGMWTASQVDYLSINKAGRCGSIGTYGVIYDTSKAYDTAGVKAILVTSGELKGQGSDGVPVSEKCISEYQNQVNDITAMFIQAVADGRELPFDTVKTLATGATWGSSDALSLGLVDAVESMEVALDNFANELNTNKDENINPNMEGKMDEEKVEIKAEETIAETVNEVIELETVEAEKVNEIVAMEVSDFEKMEAKILALEKENEELKKTQIAPASHEPIKMNLTSNVPTKKPLYVNGKLNK